MPKLPYSTGKSKELINTDDLRYNNPISYHFFEFSYITKQGLITTLPINYALWGFITIRVLIPFNVPGSKVLIGTVSDTDSVGNAVINTSGIKQIWLGQTGTEFIDKFQTPTKIYFTIRESTPSSRGKGWGIIQAINLNLIEGG